jgi:2-iminobutanoate/2-iminopropanoate deaminase
VVTAGEWVIVSGQVGLGPTGLAEGFEAQLLQALANLADRLRSVGSDVDRVVKTTVFLTDMANYDDLNRIYCEFLDREGRGVRPARSALAVAALPIGALVEVEAWALADTGRAG